MPQHKNIDTSIADKIIRGRVEPHIYAFNTGTVPNYLKVGDTQRPVEQRLAEWKEKFKDLKEKFSSKALVDDKTYFRDFEVHKYLIRERERERLQPGKFSDIYYSKEFFKDATTNDVKDAIENIIDSHTKNESTYQFYNLENLILDNFIYVREKEEKFTPRPNQEQTINNFERAWKNGSKSLLMYAVMRFGKSYTAMCCAKVMKAKVIVIVSAKADVMGEWKRTVETLKRFEGYEFLDRKVLWDKKAISKKLKANKKVVIFLTLQDLQGNNRLQGNGLKEQHKEIFGKDIDLLIIDETHFGARASEYGKVLDEKKLTQEEKLIRKEQQQQNKLKERDFTLDELESSTKVLKTKLRLHLSGTPYRILMGGEFSKDDIIAFYQFSDIAKDQDEWNKKHLNEEGVNEWDNPYFGFPQMVRFAFNPNESSRKKMDELKQNGFNYAFSALFIPKSITKDNVNQNHKKFEHEKEVLDLLQVIDGSKSDKNILGFLNYNKIKEGNMCRHIVCVLPFRASCDAFEDLIQRNQKKFVNLNTYEIINIAGVDKEEQYKDTENIKIKIKKCENEENKKTITLTVNRMLTGSTVEEWDTMLYFKDTSSPQEYDQAIFRLQNPYIKNGIDKKSSSVFKYNKKPQTLLVDFNPNRMFLLQEEKSQIYNANTDANGNSKLEERIKRELEISPIVVMNNNKMERLNGEIRDREKVMRGIKKKDSVTLIGYQLFHNYIRPHSALDGKTPSEKCGIEINGDNKWITLIQNASR